MKPEPELSPPASTLFPAEAARLRTGFDLADVNTVAQSLRRFGRRYADRVFTAGEQAYALGGTGLVAERLAARFAAKEAVMKALSLSEVGIDWRDIEVVKCADGACKVALHGRALDAARRLRVKEIHVSLSHDGGFAAAFVTAWLASPAVPTSTPEGYEP